MPPCCVLCHYPSETASNICSFCEIHLPILTHYCIQCSQILHESAALLHCGNCLKNPPPFERIFALFPYEMPIVSLIKRLKFKGDLTAAQSLGHLMANKLKNHWYKEIKLPDCIIPVPLHKARLKARGFNQALEIARPIAKILGVPIYKNSIQRVKNTLPQTTLTGIKRQHNLTLAFNTHHDFSELSIAILDDVVTTGHTVLELSRLLQQRGAKKIVVWCCARST